MTGYEADFGTHAPGRTRSSRRLPVLPVLLLHLVGCSRGGGAGSRASETGDSLGEASRLAAGLAASSRNEGLPRPRPLGSMASDAWRSLALPDSLRDLLDAGDFGQTPAGHRIVALSFLADACEAQARQDPALRDSAAACIARCLDLARQTRPSSLDAEAANEGLWLSHLNLILGARDALGPCLEPERHKAIATALARRSVREPTFHVPSYSTLSYRWPADQTATLASLARFDRAHDTQMAREPTKLWRDFLLRAAMDPSLSLPWSEATGRAKGARDPRGCALSWQTRFLQEFDPELARLFWERYKERFLVDAVLLVGFREWPKGREQAADMDSGPIVQGVGSAATALAIAAARVMEDRDLADRLEGTAATIETLAAGDKRVALVASTPLAAAIRYLGHHACPTKAADPR